MKQRHLHHHHHQGKPSIVSNSFLLLVVRHLLLVRNLLSAPPLRQDSSKIALGAGGRVSIALGGPSVGFRGGFWDLFGAGSLLVSLLPVEVFGGSPRAVWFPGSFGIVWFLRPPSLRNAFDRIVYTTGDDRSVTSHHRMSLHAPRAATDPAPTEVRSGGFVLRLTAEPSGGQVR